MSEPSVNPYAPPSEAAEAPEPAGLWMVEGEFLLVRNGARLPEVDIADRGGELTPFAMLFRAAQVKSASLWIGVAIVMAAAFSRDWIIRYINSQVWWIALAVVFVFCIRLGGSGAVGGLARVAGFISAKVQRDRLRRTIWRRRLAWLGSLLLMSPLLGVQTLRFHDFSRLYLGGSGGGLLLLLASAVWRIADAGPRCIAARNGWLYLKGFPAGALRALAGRASVAPPVMVPRKVYTLYQHQLPLGVLVGKRWMNLWIVGLLAIWKARHSPRLERPMFHPGEALQLPPECAGAALTGRWAEKTRGTALAGWTPFGVLRSDSPIGDLRVTTLSFLSPDGRQVASTSVTRLASGPFFVESFEDAIRSWRSDGRLILTTSSRAIGQQPASIETLRVRSGPTQLLAVHARRIEGAALENLDAGEVRRRSLAESLERHEVLVAAGICGETREEEFPATDEKGDENANSAVRFS